MEVGKREGERGERGKGKCEGNGWKRNTERGKG